MSQRNLRKISQNATELVFVDPKKFSNTLRITLNRAEKQAGDIRVTNARSEFISTRAVVIPQVGPDIENSRTEKLSVRVIISGSVESHEQVKQLVADTFNAITISLDDHTLGFFKEDPVYVIDLDVA